jgi:Zn-dependent peptidase ImmA (M78 family)/DNA-binding XRE family transcriptional regulator
MSNIGQRLKQARKAARLTLRSLGELVGLSHTAVQKFEIGGLVPSSDILLKFAKALNVRVDFFLRPIKVSLGTIKFRKRSNLSKKSEEAIKFEVIHQIERRLELENLYPAPPTIPFHIPAEFPKKIDQFEDIESFAEQFREYWKLGIAPIHDLIDTFENYGVWVFEVDYQENSFDGLVAVIDGQPMIVISSLWPGDRQRFDLAHELGHYVFENRLSPDLKEEQACNRFAGAFLFPRAAAFQQLGKKRSFVEWQELMLLKEQYQISIAAICYRMKDLGIIEEGYFKRLMMELKQRGWHRQEPGIKIPPEKAHGFKRMVFHALGEEYIGESKAAELLCCSIENLKALRLGEEKLCPC